MILFHSSMSSWLLIWCSLGFLTYQCLGHVTFTNLKCNYENITYGEYKECVIKAVNRTHKYVSVYGKLNYRPLVNIMMRIQMMRNDHGYKPFFINITFDACQYLLNLRNPVVNLFYTTLKQYSNMNHTCPYDHDLIVDKMWTGNYDDVWSKYFPLPAGDYILIGTFITDNVAFTKVRLYFKISD